MTEPPGGPPTSGHILPPPERDNGSRIAGIALGLVASVVAPFVSFQFLGTWLDNPVVGIFGIPVLVLVLGLLLAIRGNRALWMPFLISYVVGFIVFAGVCAVLVNAYFNSIHPG